MSEKRREPDSKKIVVIDSLVTSTNAKGIAKLLGHVGWYRELIPEYAKIAVPITHLLRNEYKFEWTEACQRALDKLRSTLSTYPVLRPLD